MSNLNGAKIDRVKRIIDFNNETGNAVQLAKIADYDLEQNELVGIANELMGVSALKDSDTTGIATAKDTKWKFMANTVSQYCMRGLPAAKRAGDDNLVQILSHPMTYFYSGSAELSLNRAVATVGSMTSVDALKILKNILPADIIILNNVVADFSKVINAPMTALHNKMAEGTEEENALLNRADFCIENMKSYVHSYYPGSKFSNEFDLTNRVLEQGVRHNPVNFHLVEAITLEPILVGTVTKTKWDIVGKNDGKGVVPFDTCVAGIQEFLAEAPGFVAQKVSAKIEMATTNEIVVKMVRVIQN